VLAPANGQPTYALHYADALASATKTVDDAQQRAKATDAALPARVDELKKTDWAKVQAIVDASDEAGRSAGFADGHDETDTVRTFWESEKDTIVPKVTGNAQHVAKEAGCNADVSGAVTFALNDAVAKQLQKRLRAKNEAFLVMERYKASLGQQNIPALEKLADDISQTSYDVHVVMVVQRDRLQALLADRDGVKKTLDRFVQDEMAYQGESGRTDAEKKASSDRIGQANKGKADIDAIYAQADAVNKQLDASIDAATKDYDAALKALRAKITEKQKAEPAPKTS
jgi:hypothetical protein